METHHSHHPTHKKKWTEYLLEFFMLFLAVFLGFVAENIREGLVNKEREKHYVENLIKDLRADIASLDSEYHYQTLESNMLDSALHVPVEKLSDVNVQDTFFHEVFLYYSLLPSFWRSNNTINQLKSGGFNLFKNNDVVDSISQLDRYYELVAFDNKYNETCYWDVAHMAQSIIRMPEPAVDWEDPIIWKIPYRDKKFTTNDPREFEHFYSLLANARGSFKTTLDYEQKFKVQTIRLIDFLKHKYNLDD